MRVPTALATVIAVCTIQSATAQQSRDAAQDSGLFQFEGTKLDVWSAEAASEMARTPQTTIPVMPAPEHLFSEDYVLWDAWPIRDRDGQIALIDGHAVLVSLTAERGDFDTEFYTRATWRYWTRAQGGAWEYGGPVFPQGTALGSRQWAGSAMYDADTGKVHFFYTAVGQLTGGSPDDVAPHGPQHPGYGRPSTVQRMALATATVGTSDGALRFTDFSDHRIILEADGKIYMTEAQYQAADVVYGMRDPWYFQHDDGRDCVLFTANTNYLNGSRNGAIGLGCSADGLTAEWNLEEPVLVSDGVTAQLERPHLVRRDDGLYLFISTHGFLFPDSFRNAPKEGLFGFFAESGDLDGPWTPINGHGLVAGNPATRPLQSYSYLVLPDLSVTSYLNKVLGLDIHQPELTSDWLGSPAPTFDIVLEKGRAGVAGIADIAKNMAEKDTGRSE